jgi:mono/diheme cytochrome c family protein
MKKSLLVLFSLAALTTLAQAADVAANWDANCNSCHGKDGKGATKAGRMAGAKDFTDAAYQKSFTDEKAFEGVKNGIKDDKGKEKMKSFADKLTDDEIKALVAQVRTFGK